jgi:hypothetical protein
VEEIVIIIKVEVVEIIKMVGKIIKSVIIGIVIKVSKVIKCVVVEKSSVVVEKKV